MSEEDEDEQLVESSAPVTKQPRTAAVEGDADEHHVGHAMAPPPTSDSTDTDVPIGQVAMTPSKHTSIGGSTSAVTASTPSRVNPINDDVPMVRRLDGTCEALPSKVVANRRTRAARRTRARRRRRPRRKRSGRRSVATAGKWRNENLRAAGAKGEKLAVTFGSRR